MAPKKKFVEAAVPVPDGLTADEADAWVAELAAALNAADPKLNATSRKDYQPGTGDPPKAPKKAGSVQPMYFCHGKF